MLRLLQRLSLPLTIFLGLASFPHSAYSGRFNVMLGGTWQNLNSSTLVYSRQLGYAVGVSKDWVPFTFRVPHADHSVHFIGLELGLFYLQNKSLTEIDSVNNVTSSTTLQVPLLFKFWINKLFSIGVGPFYAMNLGEPTNSPVGGTASSIGEAPSSDFGLVGGLKLSFRENNQWWFVEGRFSSSMATKSSSLGTYYYDNILVLVGMQFGKSPYDLYHLY